MKSFALFLAVALGPCAWAQNTPAPAPSATPAPSVASQVNPSEDLSVKKARLLLDQMVQALGGEAYLSIQDMEQQGRTYGFYHGNPSGTGTVFWRFWKWPDKDRVELTKQRDVIYINNGDTGWEITYKGTRLQDPEDLKTYLRNRHYALEHVLGWLKEPGVALFYAGGGIAEYKQVEKVTIMNTKHEAVTLFIDALSHLPVKKSYTLRDPQFRDLNTEEEVYDNWRVEQGVNTAHSITAFHNGERLRQRFIQSARYNVGLPDSKFTATVTYDPTKKPSR